MRVCSFNIHGGKSEARVPSLGQITQTLRDADCDVILVQEVDRFLLRSGVVHQARVLARDLDGYSYRFYGRLRFGPLAFGNAILSRVPITKTLHASLGSPGGEPRGAIGVRLENQMTVWNTHLGLRDDWRQEQLAHLAGAIASASALGEPVLLGGDFNARLDAPEIQTFLAQANLSVLSDDAPTFPNSLPAHRIDFFFGRNVQIKRAETREGSGSDHRLILLETL